MIILGINFSHDASVSIIKDGKIIAAIEEEKVSRKKQDFGWPKQAIDRLFYEHEIKNDDVNYISLDQMLLSELSYKEINFRFNKNKINKKLEYLDRITSYLNVTNRTFEAEDNLKSINKNIFDLGFTNAKVVFHDHHLSHAASAFYTSPLKTDLVVTSDGMGGDSSFNFYMPNKGGLKLIKKNNYSVSVGAFYSMITKLLGYRPTRHEGKITGLAAYGKKTKLLNTFRDLWKYEKSKLTRYPFGEIKSEWKRLKIDEKFSFSEKINFSNSSGEITNTYSKLNLILLSWLKEQTKGFSSEDIAFACQQISEEITLNEIKNVLKERKLKDCNVALAGGVFANVRINQLIYELDCVKNIFVHPAMGDSGLALGNAILTNNQLNNDISENQFRFKDTFLGPNYSKDLKQFISTFKSDNVSFKKMSAPSLHVAKLLNDNKIIGLWNGALEWGPRALGNRSIILNTFDKKVNDTLNERLNRTEFMPFAPVVLDSLAKEYFPKYDSNVPAADYMTMTYDTNPKYHKMLQATVHVDGTARPQIAYKKTSPFYYSILEDFYKISGCGALVNTSFNAHEEPILSTPETAINSLLNGRVDFLVMEDYIFELKEIKS